MSPRFPAAAAVLWLAASPLAAQSQPFSGPAAVSLIPGRTNVALSSVVEMGVTIDLTGISGSCAGLTVPAVLGSYVLPVEFDRASLRFVGSRSCGAGGYSASPVTTSVEKANADGRVTLADTSPGTAPSGDAICLAILLFEGAASGGSTALTVEGAGDVSSQFLSCGPGSFAGPDRLPSTPAAATLQLHPLLRGDASGDGAVDLSDAVALVARSPEAALVDRDDINGDGVVSVADVFALVRQLIP